MQLIDPLMGTETSDQGADNDLPAKWRRVSEILDEHVGAGNYVIAGGSVRDFLMDRPHKDIDVFVTWEAWNKALNFGLDAAVCTTDPFACNAIPPWTLQLGVYHMANVAAYGTWLANVADTILHSTETYKHPELGTIQIIVLKIPSPIDPALVVGRMDFGICRAWLDKQVLAYTAEFLTDMGNRTMTLLRADTEHQFDYSMSRFEKLTRERYKGWGFVDGRATP